MFLGRQNSLTFKASFPKRAYLEGIPNFTKIQSSAIPGSWSFLRFSGDWLENFPSEVKPVYHDRHHAPFYPYDFYDDLSTCGLALWWRSTSTSSPGKNHVRWRHPTCTCPVVTLYCLKSLNSPPPVIQYDTNLTASENPATIIYNNSNNSSQNFKLYLFIIEGNNGGVLLDYSRFVHQDYALPIKTRFQCNTWWVMIRNVLFLLRFAYFWRFLKIATAFWTQYSKTNLINKLFWWWALDFQFILQAGFNVKDDTCPDGTCDPSSQTCCLYTGGWGCCPYANAVCCSWVIPDKFPFFQRHTIVTSKSISSLCFSNVFFFHQKRCP